MNEDPRQAADDLHDAMTWPAYISMAEGIAAHERERAAMPTWRKALEWCSRRRWVRKLRDCIA